MPFNYLLLDLDGTLYPHHNGLWDQIAARMERFMKDVIDIPEHLIPSLREEYFHQYGTTLAGLRANYSMDEEEYLDYVHDIDLAPYISSNKALRKILMSTPAKKWIFTNASNNHARSVLEQLEINDLFEGIIDITALNYNSKPSEIAYQIALHTIGLPPPSDCLFVDDIPKNLIGAKRFGIQTVLVSTNESTNSADYQINDISQLGELFQQISES